MSEQEQDAVIGRTVREHTTAKQKLAALIAQSHKHAGDLRTVAEQLKPKFDATGNEPNHSPEIFTKAFARYPSKEELTALMDDMDATKTVVKELAASLRGMGVDPKE